VKLKETDNRRYVCGYLTPLAASELSSSLLAVRAVRNDLVHSDPVAGPSRTAAVNQNRWSWRIYIVDLLQLHSHPLLMSDAYLWMHSVSHIKLKRKQTRTHFWI